MTPEQIKELLILSFKSSFDIDKKLDIYNDEFQDFIHNIHLEIGVNGVYQYAYLDVEGFIKIGQNRTIDYWEITKIETTLNGEENLLKIFNYELG